MRRYAFSRTRAVWEAASAAHLAGRWVTLRSLARDVGQAAHSNIIVHIDRLERLGYVVRDSGGGIHVLVPVVRG